MPDHAPKSRAARPTPLHRAAADLAVRWGAPGLLYLISPRRGGLVEALADAGIEEGRLVLVEADPALARRLAWRFPRARVVVAPAAAVPVLIQAEANRSGLSAGAVTCGLPLMLMPRAERASFARDCLAGARPGAPFVCWAPWPVPVSPLPSDGAGPHPAVMSAAARHGALMGRAFAHVIHVVDHA